MGLNDKKLISEILGRILILPSCKKIQFTLIKVLMCALAIKIAGASREALALPGARCLPTLTLEGLLAASAAGHRAQ